MIKVRNKVRWCKHKLKRPDELEGGSFEERLEEVATGSGEQRQRIRTKVPAFGVRLDEDEIDCLSLPPK